MIPTITTGVDLNNRGGWMYNVIVNITTFSFDGLRGTTTTETEQVRLTAYDDRDARMIEITARAILARLGVRCEVHTYKEPMILKEVGA